ncbi:MAG: biotin transporter BioY [Candidatus Heimdallarchaeota archaeon]
MGFNINELLSKDRFSINIFWLHNKSIFTKVTLSMIFACLTGLFAQIRLYLPWTPIPITLQSLAVFGSGIFLGSWFGGLSQILYILYGLMGIPWFAGRNAGVSVLLGPSGGYIIGFIFASFFIGKIVEKFKEQNKATLLISSQIFISNYIIIYGLGLTQLYQWYYFVEGTKLSLIVLLSKGAFPFIVGDLIKIGVSILLLARCMLMEYKGE